MSLFEDFEAAAERVTTLEKRPDNATLLQLYALYKQGSVGDVDGDEPSPFDFVKKAKYEAWEELEGTSKEDAQKRYIELVNQLAGS